MTTTKNNEHKKLNFSSEREQSQACLNSAEHEKNQGRKVLNVPNLRFPEFQGEWEEYRIEDITENISSGRCKSHSSSGKYNLYGSTGIIGKTNEACYEGNLVLVARVGANAGSLQILNEPCGITDNTLIIKPKEVDVQYIYYFLQHFNLNRLIFGSGQPLITGGMLKKVKVSLGTIQEQNKITRLLSVLDERITTQNKIIDKLQSLIKGINQRVFMNSGTNYKLGEICEIRNGYSGSQHLSKKGLKVSRIETISGHKVNTERVGYVAPFESSENYRLRVGDILFSNINSVEYIGNTAFIDKDYDLYHGMNLLRLTPNNMVVIPFYLYLLLNTNRMLNRFKTVCNKAVSQASINQTELGKTVVQIPDINAQKQICELYQALYDKLESEKYANSLFQKQKQYLLRQMFI